MKVLQLKRHVAVRALVFEPGGGLLVADDRCVWRLDPDSGEAAVAIHCGGGLIAFQPATHRAALAPRYLSRYAPHPQTGVWLADTRDPRPASWLSLVRDVAAVRDVAFSPSGELVAAAYLERDDERPARGRLGCWPVDGVGLRWALEFSRPVRAVALGDGGWFAVAVGYWNRTEVRVYQPGDAVPAGSFVPGRGRGQKLCSAGGSAFVGLSGARLFVVRTEGPPVVTAPVDRRGTLRDVAVSPDGRFVVTVGDDRHARTWRASDAELVSAVNWGIGPLTAVAFAPDGLTCAAAGKGGQVVVWDVDG